MPTISTTLGALANAESPLKKLLDMRFDQPGGARLRYHVAKLARLVGAETSHFYAERNRLIADYGAGEPPCITPASANWATFLNELRPIERLEVTIAWGPVTMAMVEPYAEITAADLLALGPLFELDEPTEDTKTIVAVQATRS